MGFVSPTLGVSSPTRAVVMVGCKGLCATGPGTVMASSLRELSETVPVLHLYSDSFGCLSAERKVEEFETDVGGCHSMSLTLLSQGNSLLI